MIDIDKPRYDQSSYLGRLRHFANITSPVTLFATNAQLENAKKLVADYKQGLVKDVDEDTLWKAKTLVDSTFHPDTGEKILLPFRMASFVPTNLVIVAGMLLPNPSIASIVFWQWVNQSVNVAFNYMNANKSTEMNMSETATAYFSAVASSCGIALGMNQWLKRTKSFSPGALAILKRTVPFTAVATAGVLNVFLMRQKELVTGIDVTDEQGNILGKSTSAGMSAISQVAVSRVASAFPAVFMPALLMTQIEKNSFFKRNPRLVAPVNILSIAASLSLLPFSIALFPQRASLPVHKLESKFQNLKNAEGQPIETVYFNRGL